MDRDWQNEVLGFSFADTWVLLGLPLLLLVWWWRLGRPTPSIGFPSLGPLENLPRSLRARLSNVPQHLTALALLPLCLALARPQSLTRLPTHGEGIDIFLSLDVSSSMSARDMDPKQERTRIEVAKEVALDFIEGRVDDRIGLSTFALFPDLICPMTLDHEALKRFLDPVDHKPQNDPEDKTGIGAGVADCVELLEKSEAASKVVILITDGQENVNWVAPGDAAKLAKDAGVRVYAIGVGRGVQMPLIGGWQKPDFTALRDMADKTGAAFWEADDEDALQTIFQRIDELEKSELADPLFIADELFFPFLAVGVALLFLAFFLRLGWLAELP